MRLLLVVAICMAASGIAAQIGTWNLETTSAWPTARWGHSAVAHDGRMWVIAGESISGANSQVLSSADGTNWTLVSSAQFPARWSHASVAFNGRIWVFGGYGALNLTSSRSDVWSSADGMIWTQHTASAPWSNRGSLAAVVYGNRMWILGGQHGTINFNDVWSSSDGANWTLETGSAGWSARGSHGVHVFKGRMWVLGGLHSSSSLNHDDVWSSSNGVNWTLETANPGWSSRRGHATAIYSDRLWVMGGGGAGIPGVTRNSIQLGLFNNEFWSSADGINWVQELPPPGWSARRGHRVVEFDGKLWLLGGLGQVLSSSVLLNDVWSYEAIPLTAEIKVLKFYDLDLDGQPGPSSSEPGIPGWPFELRLALDDSLIDSGVTDANGELKFVVDADATEYKVIEIQQQPYINTTPLVQTVIADQPLINVYFGNVALQGHYGLGRTRGFWGASPNSLKLYDAAFPAWAERINQLGLVDNAGDRLVLSTTDVQAATDEMRDWFTSKGPSNNRAHQLSAQMAAAVLNVYAGAMSGTPGVFIHCRGSLRHADEVFDMAAELLDANPIVLGNHASSARMAMYKDLFENLNNNTEPVYIVQPGPVPVIQQRTTLRRR